MNEEELKKARADLEKERERLKRDREILQITAASTTSNYGKLTPYVHNSGETWKVYMERVEHYFSANLIKSGTRKRDILLSVMGADNYRVLRKSCFPAKTNELTIDDINIHMTKIFDLTTNKIVAITQFAERNQLPNESFIQYITELKGIAENCEFTNLDESLCMRLISGRRDLSLKEKILSMDTFNYDSILAKALIHESAHRNAMSLHGQNTDGSTTLNSIHSSRHSRQHGSRHQTRAAGVQQQQQRPQPTGAHGAHQQYRRTRCMRCGGSHTGTVCKYINTVCNFCKRTGHLKKVCLKLKSILNQTEQACGQQQQGVQQQGGQQQHRGQYQGNPRRHQGNHFIDLNNITHPAESELEGDLDDIFGLSLYHVSTEDVKIEDLPPIILPCKVNNYFIDFQVDSGAVTSLIGSDTYNKLWPQGLPLQPVDRDLKTWSKELLLVKGCAWVQVEFKNKIQTLPLIVLHKPGPSILGRNWFPPLNINISNNDNIISQISHNDGNTAATAQQSKQPEVPQVPKEIEDIKDVFDEELGCYTGPPVSIELKEEAKPVFRPPRQVPYARVEAAEKTIDEHVKDGFMSPVKFSSYATPVHFVPRNDGTLRMVGDYSGTINPVSKIDIFPMPTIDSILDNLAQGKYFTKLDLKRAFNQITVDEQSAEILTLNTSKGLFKVHRLSQGLSVAPAIFQRTMSMIFAGAPGVSTYFDDVLIQGSSKEELWARTREVLLRLQKFGLRLNLSKCIFCVTHLDFVGYHISGTGITPTNEKVEALVNMPEPTEKSELQSFLGYINYYDRFLRSKAAQFFPLYQLLRDGVKWTWGEAEQRAVNYVKKIMTSNVVLVPFNSKLPITLAVDASERGIGYVISHQMPDGSERPIANGSRSLRPCEKKYSQLDKEALAIVCGVKKFHKYLYGTNFIIFTDHKPLLGIFRPNKPTPETLSPRLIRWCIYLSGYLYTLKHRPGKSNGNADCLSRLPLPSKPGDEFPEPAGILLLERSPASSMFSPDKLAEQTKKDPELSRVINIVQHGGSPAALPTEYQRRISSLSNFRL